MEMANKIRKSFLKRFKLTGRGKILRRVAGRNHFLAEKSSRVLRRKKILKIAPKDFLKYKNY